MKDDIDITAARCDGKERYRTAALAWEVLKRRSRRISSLSVYRCPDCGFHHIGDNRSQRRRGMRRSRTIKLG